MAIILRRRKRKKETIWLSLNHSESLEINWTKSKKSSAFMLDQSPAFQNLAGSQMKHLRAPL